MWKAATGCPEQLCTVLTDGVGWVSVPQNQVSAWANILSRRILRCPQCQGTKLMVAHLCPVLTFLKGDDNSFSLTLAPPHLQRSATFVPVRFVERMCASCFCQHPAASRQVRHPVCVHFASHDFGGFMRSLLNELSVDTHRFRVVCVASDGSHVKQARPVDV